MEENDSDPKDGSDVDGGSDADGGSEADGGSDLFDPPGGVDDAGGGDDPSSRTVVSIDDLSSPASIVARELLTAPEPTTAVEVAEVAGANVDAVADFASTLALFEHVLTDSRAPSLEDGARFTANPIVEWATTATKIVRLVDSAREIDDAMARHDERLEDLEAETGFESARAYSEAVFDDDGDRVPETEQTETLALQWTLTEERRSTLARVRENYEFLSDRLEGLTERTGFDPTSVDPPETESRRHLEPPEPPFF